MNDSLEDISGVPRPAPYQERAAHRESDTPNRLPGYVSFLILLAAISTLAGYRVARFEIAGLRWFHTAPPLASALVQRPVLVPASDRSEERRVGKECRDRVSTDHLRK